MKDSLIKFECSESDLQAMIESAFTKHSQSQTQPPSVKLLKKQVTAKEARKLLLIAVPTINRYRRQGWITSVMRGGKRMYDYDSLVDFIENPPSDFK